MVWGGGQGVAFRARHRGRVACAPAGAYMLRPAPASNQTPLDAPSLYKTHTLVCWLYPWDYKAYKALKCWVATCVPTCP
jgi:hypothetical protein